MSQIGGLLEQPADEVVGKVRLLMISRIVNERLDEFLAGFHRQHPRVDLQIDVMRSSDIVAALQEKTATAGLSLNRKA
ncbi:LysR substrate-binding domain-containing protein, partial [Klebsiella pneumoniae]|nr:LysR substrate-binding domain-containing protein [Klebsiella pneumoniae]